MVSRAGGGLTAKQAWVAGISDGPRHIRRSRTAQALRPTLYGSGDVCPALRLSPFRIERWRAASASVHSATVAGLCCGARSNSQGAGRRSRSCRRLGKFFVRRACGGCSVKDGKVAAVVAQAAAMDNVATVLRLVEYAGYVQLLKLTWLGVMDVIHSIFRMSPRLVPARRGPRRSGYDDDTRVWSPLPHPDGAMSSVPDSRSRLPGTGPD